MFYIYDTFNSQQNQENQVNSSPTTDLWKNPPNLSAEQSTNCQPCLAAWSSGTGFAGIAGYACSLAFGSADICFRYGPFSYDLIGGGHFNMTKDGTWGRWVKRWVTSIWNVKNLASTKKPLWPSSSFKSMLVGIPSFLAFMFKGVKLHVKTCVLLKGRNAERCLSRFLCWNFEDFQKKTDVHWKWWSLKSLTSKFCLNKNGLLSHRSSSW